MWLTFVYLLLYIFTKISVSTRLLEIEAGFPRSWNDTKSRGIAVIPAVSAWKFTETRLANIKQHKKYTNFSISILGKPIFLGTVYPTGSWMESLPCYHCGFVYHCHLHDYWWYCYYCCCWLLSFYCHFCCHFYCHVSFLLIFIPILVSIHKMKALKMSKLEKVATPQGLVKTWVRMRLSI